jgi:hypothetical protein
MNTRPFPALLIAICATLAFATACKKDEPESTPPPTPSPPADPRAAYTGNWLVRDSLWLGGMPYNPPFVDYVLNISTGGTVSDTLYFNNLWNDGAAYYALLAGVFFSFPSQNVSGPYDMSGNGSFTGTQLFYQTTGDVYLHRGHGEKQ